MDKHLMEILSRETEEEILLKSGANFDRKLYSSGKNFVINESKLGDMQQNIHIRTHTRYTYFPEHSHNFAEIMIVLSGSVTHRIGDRKIVVRKGEALVLNKHTKHSIDRAGANDIGVNIILSDRFTESVSAQLVGTIFSTFFKENAKENGDSIYLHFRFEGEKKIENLIENILFELTEKSDNKHVLSMSVELLLNYLSLLSNKILLGGTLNTDKEAKRMEAVVSYIKQNIKGASLTEISKKLSLTTPYLSKFIKNYSGKTFKELLVEERIERALDMVESTELPISQIIHSVGYENESYFHKQFKATTGISPLNYRKNIKKQSNR